jgi:protein-disulfide isomerase
VAKGKRVRQQRAAAEAATGRRKPPPVKGAPRARRGMPAWGWLLVALGIAAVFGVALIVASRFGVNETPRPEVEASGQLAFADEVNAMLEGVPQDGLALGDPDAPVTLVEFADLQCPYCAQWASETLPVLVDEYVKPGKLRIEFRPLSFIGDDSTRGAELAVAAGEQERLWHVVELMYRNQGGENTGWISNDFVDALGRSIPGLDAEQWLADADGERPAQVLQQAQVEASQQGINSTPSFLLGRTGGEIKKIEVTSLGPDGLRSKIDALLER